MKKRHDAEQIVAKLRRPTTADGKIRGMAPEVARQMRGLEKENVRLKKLAAKQALDNQILKEAPADALDDTFRKITRPAA